MCYVTIFEHCLIKSDRERSVMCYVTIFDHCWIKSDRERGLLDGLAACITMTS